MMVSVTTGFRYKKKKKYHRSSIYPVCDRRFLLDLNAISLLLYLDG